MPLQKIWAFPLLIILVISPASLANADLNASLNDMFTRYGGRVNVTSPGAYEAQTRGFIVGGSISARMPQDTLQPFSIKAPEIKAGCGGIDIFGGSFSFINADQFVAFAKKVGQNALGYAFSLGLEAVCPTCNSVIKDLRSVMNAMNKFNMDSCMAAKALVNTAASGAGLASLEKCKQVKGGGDPVTGWLECAAGTESEIRGKLRDNALVNTATAKADGTKAISLGSTTAQAAAKTGLSNDQRQMMVSIMGTWTTSADADDCTYTPASLNLADLVEGGDLKMLTCGSGGFGDGETCENITSVTVPTGGFAKLSRTKMEGILTKYKAKTTLTDDEKAFVNAMPIPPVAYMLQHSLAYSEQLANALIDLTSEVAGAMMAWQAIENYVKLFEGGKTSIGDLCGLTTADYASEVRQVRESRTELFGKYMKGLEMQATLITFMASIDAKVAALASHTVNQALAYKIPGA